MTTNGIHHFASESDQKAAVAERFNRTLKTRIWTYLSAKLTQKLVVALPAILKFYNGSYHRSIGMAPNKVTKDDQDQIWTQLYGDGDTYLKRHRKVESGAKVRISRVKGGFDIGYMPNWSREQLTVSSLNLPVDKKKSVTPDRCAHSRTIAARNFAVNGTRKRFSKSVTTTTKSSG